MKKSILFFGLILSSITGYSQNTFPTAANTAVGIGTGTGAVSGTGGLRLKVTSGVAGTSGIQLTNVTSGTTPAIGNSRALSVDASGNIILTPVVNTAAADVSIYNNDGTLAGNRNVTMNGKNLTFTPTNANSQFFINGTTGYSGFGTITPTERLEVSGTLKAKQGVFKYSPANGTTYANFADKIKACLVLSAGTPLVDSGAESGTFNYMDFPSNSTDTPNPTIWLEMSDRGLNTRYRFFAAQNSNSEFSMFNKTGTDFFKLTEDGAGKATMLLTQANSFLGIGTSTFVDGSDTYRLSVKGAIRADRVRVYTTWADYVFNKEYNLPSLEEVEQHIKDNGHLKDIPSAKEVEEKGIELGEMNKLLLQKVEELTLYMIEMNKEITTLKSQIKNN